MEKAPEVLPEPERLPMPQTPQDELNNLYMFDYDPSKLKSALSADKEKDNIFKFKMKNRSVSKEETRLEILFSRCEALYAHGYMEQACVLAELLAEYYLKTVPVVNGDEQAVSHKSSNVNNTNNNNANLRQRCLSNFQNTVLWRCNLLCSILHDAATSLNADLNRLAFRIGLLGLETARLPAISKALEVKLINQEQELVNLLKKLQIGTLELELVRDRALKLKDSCAPTPARSNFLSLPIMLASFVFEILYNYSIAYNNEPNNKTIDDANAATVMEELAFDAAIAALGMKANISESQHPLLCEGIRRQKGDLALTLLLTYKDDEQRLLRIMDKILDRDVHVLFRQMSTLNPFNPNLKKIQQQQLQEFIQLGSF